MLRKAIPVVALFVAAAAFADAAVEPAVPNVEDNIHAMDTDHDGMVSVSEMRAYLEARHGKNYEKALLDDLEAKAVGKSCASPFSRSLY
jgi:hypothetical protein